MIDYSGKDVTPKNFLAILRGDAKGVKGGNGKVLKTTSEDRIFINYADHGSVGLVAFPSGGYLYEKDLTETFKYLYENNLY